MTKMITTTLKDLPSKFTQKINLTTNPITSVIPKSTDPLVDGTALTTNEDIKHRRKRIIARPKNYRKHAKIREFQALCNWLIGKGSPLEKPTIQHKNILSAVRNNTVIPDAYEPWIKENYDLVSKAACTKPKELDKKWEIYIFNNRKIEDKLIQEVGEQVNTIEKEDSTVTQETDTRLTMQKGQIHVDRYIEKLKQWSKTPSTASITVCLAIRHYQVWGDEGYSKYYPKSLLIAMKQEPELAKSIYSDSDKRQVRPLVKEELDKTFSELYYTTNTGKTSCKDWHVSSAPASTNTIPDTLTLLIQLAKKAGASEVTIKL